MKQRYTGDYGGIPVFYILEPDGTVTASSFNEEGRNVGAPAADWEIAWFGEVMKKVARRMTTDDISFLVRNLTEKPLTG